jgi:5-oxoprolinase (ATP-hydrolysing) subunit B
MATREPWRWVGDRALLKEVPAGPTLAARNQAARGLAVRLADLALSEVEDLVVGAVSLLVVLRPGTEPSPKLRAALEDNAPPAVGRSGGERIHDIEVAYGGDAGPDLGEVARLHGTSERDVVSLHASARYTVGFLGFTPGFAYLIGLPAALATPRLATPRTRVEAGSVAIGGEFTGIYPRATPGGWRIIGRADVTLFDAALDRPAHLAPGDLVRFIAR